MGKIVLKGEEIKFLPWIVQNWERKIYLTQHEFFDSARGIYCSIFYLDFS